MNENGIEALERNQLMEVVEEREVDIEKRIVACRRTVVSRDNPGSHGEHIMDGGGVFALDSPEHTVRDTTVVVETDKREIILASLG